MLTLMLFVVVALFAVSFGYWSSAALATITLFIVAALAAGAVAAVLVYSMSSYDIRRRVHR